MKRSEINAIIREGESFIRELGFHLPPFAYWSPSDWNQKGPEAHEIVDARLGWDVTDFGSGDYLHTGLFLFTLRNGNSHHSKKYAEKLMIVGENQKTPLHFHWNKCEDIINRGGGRLLVQLYNATQDDNLADTKVVVTTDGVERHVDPGEVIILRPGESVTLPPHLYHTFRAVDSKVLAGEVSMVNDDGTDNHFYRPAGRFPIIVEDEAPLYLLVGDYEKYYMVQPSNVNNQQ